MLNLDPEKLLAIAVLALIVLGPNKLPGAARSVGRVVGQLRRMSGSFQSELRDALAEPRQVLQHAVDEFGISDARSSMTSLADTFRPTSLIDPFRAPSPAPVEARAADVRAADLPAPAPDAALRRPADASAAVPDDPALN